MPFFCQGARYTRHFDWRGQVFPGGSWFLGVLLSCISYLCLAHLSETLVLSAPLHPRFPHPLAGIHEGRDIALDR